MASKITKIVADFSTTLATAVAAAGTTATLLSIVDDDGVNLPAGNYCLTVDGNISQKEYWFCAVDSSGNITAIQSVSRQGVLTSGSTRSHRVGAEVVITDFITLKILSDLVSGASGLDATHPLIYDADPTISDDKHIATKKYVDGVAVSGAPNASTTVKGIVEEATQAEADAKTAVGGTSARLFTNPSVIRAANVNDYVASDTGAADAYAIATAPVITAYAEGQVFIFKSAHANTTASTLAVCGLATKPIVKNYNVALVAGDIKAGQVVVVVYDGTSMQMVSPRGTDAASLYQLLSNLDTTTTLGTSNTLYPSQNAVKTYVDTQIPAVAFTAVTNGVASHAMNQTNVQTIAHGLGKVPKFLRVLTTYNNGSFGSYNGSTYACTYNQEGGTKGTSTNDIIIVTDGNPAYTNVATVTWDATNIYLHWSGSGFGATVYFMWEAFC